MAGNRCADKAEGTRGEQKGPIGGPAPDRHWRTGGRKCPSSGKTKSAIQSNENTQT